MAVPALRAGAGGDHVTHTRKARKGFGLTAEGLAESAHLGQPTGDECRAGVVTGAQSVAHAHRNGNNVLQHPPQLAADDVLIGVHAEQAIVQSGLQCEGSVVRLKCEHTGGRLTCDDLAGEVGSGQHPGNAMGRDVADDLGHAHPAALLQPLTQTDHRDISRHAGQGVHQHLAEVAAGDGNQDGVGVLDRDVQLGRSGELGV